MILNITSTVNDTRVIPVIIPYRTPLQFAPAWVWIGATAAVLFFIVCMMWVISRHVRSTDKYDDSVRTVHQMGQPTIGANFPSPLVNYTAPGLTTGLQYFQQVKAGDHTLENVENKKPLLLNMDYTLFNFDKTDI